MFLPGAKKSPNGGGNYMYLFFLNVSAFFSGSGLQIGKPRRPARVKVSSFDVRTTLGSRKRSGERLKGVKVDTHGSDFLIFDLCLEMSSFSHRTGPADPVYVVITQRLFSHAVLTSLVALVLRILKNCRCRGHIIGNFHGRMVWCIFGFSDLFWDLTF